MALDRFSSSGIYIARGLKCPAGVPPLGGSFTRIPAKAGTPASADFSRAQCIVAAGECSSYNLPEMTLIHAVGKGTSTTGDSK
jgi:hypothetical protein